MKMVEDKMYLEGIIQSDGQTIIGDNARTYHLPVLGTDEDGFPEVIVDAKDVGGDGWMRRQSVKKYIGMKVGFHTTYDLTQGMDYKILKGE